MRAPITAAPAWVDEWGTVSDIVAAVATLLTLASVLYVAVQVALQRKQLHRDLENLYVERYWTVLDRLQSSSPHSEERERAILAYLGLSEDQCDLREQGRVTDETWRIWGTSIYSATQDDEYRSALALQPEDQFLHLRRMSSEGPTYDPTVLKASQRRRQGL